MSWLRMCYTARHNMGDPYILCYIAATSRQSSLGVQHTLRIWAASSGLGTVCSPVPSTSQTSARPMDHRPVSPEASSALPRKKMGRRRRRSHGLAPVLICHTARPATAICKTWHSIVTQPYHMCKCAMMRMQHKQHVRLSMLAPVQDCLGCLG